MQHPDPESPTGTEAPAWRRPPRCPDYVEAKSVEDLVPFMEAVARRAYSGGLWPGWDLQPGERVLLRVDSWHDPLCVEAAVKLFEKWGCPYEVITADLGPMPTRTGVDEIEVMMGLTRELGDWMRAWEKLDAERNYDKVLWGFGGPILRTMNMRIQRFPFMTPEMVMSAANTIPGEVLVAIDEWTWERIRNARTVHITDPEGTDLWYTSRDEYWNADRTYFNDEAIQHWYPQNPDYARTYLPGHIWGKPNFLLPPTLEDLNGVAAGTLNDLGPYPHLRLKIEDTFVRAIEGGGQFGEKLRRIQDVTKDLQYPGNPLRGLLHLWEASIGTNPGVYRPRKGFGDGWNCGLNERMRSGVIHLGFGTVVSSWPEIQAAEAGFEWVGHWHIHLDFATYTVEYADGTKEQLISGGRLKALDDPDVRELASRLGDPDDLLEESWVPAVPGINVDGDYERDYAQDPATWVQTELTICRKWHHLYMKMTGAEHRGHNHD
jgi:hypothetical protein